MIADKKSSISGKLYLNLSDFAEYYRSFLGWSALVRVLAGDRWFLLGCWQNHL